MLGKRNETIIDRLENSIPKPTYKEVVGQLHKTHNMLVDALLRPEPVDINEVSGLLFKNRRIFEDILRTCG